MKTRDDIVELLSTSIGEEAAGSLVDASVARRGIDPTAITKLEALDVLEDIAGEQGLAGVTARFAKSKVHLRWTIDDERS